MDVTVVGAGIVGLAVAHELAARGASVEVLDTRGTARGATRASAGILAPHIEGHTERMLDLGLKSLALYDDFVARVGDGAGQAVEYRRNGTLEVARDHEEAASLDAAAGRLVGAGVPHTLGDGAAALALEPALATDLVRSLFIPDHGFVGVPSLVSALVAAGVRRGVSLSVERVARIALVSGGVRVWTESRTIDSGAVVIAAGSWSGAIASVPDPVERPVSDPIARPVRGQLMHLRFPQPLLSRVVWGSACYMVPWSDGSLLVGATVEQVGFDESATVGGVSQMLSAGMALLPGAREAVFQEVRTGLRPGTPDQLPVVGASSTMQGVFYATGHYRNGVLLAPWTARVLADLVLHGSRAAELDLVQPGRFGL